MVQKNKSDIKEKPLKALISLKKCKGLKYHKHIKKLPLQLFFDGFIIELQIISEGGKII